MLPRLLCEQLCSLNPDEDRLAFSVEWTISESGEVLIIKTFISFYVQFEDLSYLSLETQLFSAGALLFRMVLIHERHIFSVK